jgi:hypothetical protein
MTPNNTVIQSALKPVHQKLPLDTGNLGPQNRALLAVLPQSKCSPDSAFSPSAHMEMQLVGTVVLPCTTSLR